MSEPAPLDGSPGERYDDPSPLAEILPSTRATKPLAPGLYLVSTPIGNLEDITLRALRVLRDADRIACEDTRQTAKLLHHFGLSTPTVSYHLHNEQSRAKDLVVQLREGARIAIVSDAGTPGIADPGVAIVHATIQAGIAVYAVPGANALLSALIVSGLGTERFTFHGFLPSKSGERRSALEAVQRTLAADDGETKTTQIFYETPHRILDALADIAAVFGPAHRIALSRELTKLHEETLRGTVGELRAQLAARDTVRGEMVLLLAGTLERAETGNGSTGLGSIGDAVRALMHTEKLNENDALKRVARDRGIGKSEAYREWQRTRRR